MSGSDRPKARTDPAGRRGYARLVARGLSLEAWMYSPQLPALRAVAGAHPETQVVIDHIGTPPGLGGPYGGLSDSQRADIEAQWRDELAALAALPQVHLKLSGFTMPIVGWGLHHGQSATVAQLAERLGPHIRYAIELFGVERCMFASNFPMDKVSASFVALFKAFGKITEDLGEDDRAQLFAGTAKRFYRL